MSLHEYRKKHGSYYFYGQNENDIICMADRVAIIFDSENYVLLKHGPEDRIEQIYADMQTKYRKSGLDDIADNLRIISSREWDVDELNKIIHHTGYIRFFLEDNGIK